MLNRYVKDETANPQIQTALNAVFNCRDVAAIARWAS